MSNPPDSSWWEYRRDLYVSRGDVEGKLIRWMNEPTQLPILSLVGPPGVGKSWLLAHLRDEIESSNPPGKPPRFILHRDAGQLIDSSQENKIKRAVIDAANTCCPGLGYPEDFSPTLPALIEDVRNRLCRRCSSPPPLLLVDGCDDLASPEDFDHLQQDILTPFFSAGAQCFRMVIARRRPLTDYFLRMKSTSLTIGLFENAEDASEEQMKKLLHTYFHLNNTVLAELKGSLPEDSSYKWNHPYINSFLMVNYIGKHIIDSGILADCCLSLINRPISFPELSARRSLISMFEINELINLAELEDRWTSDMFREMLKRNLDYDDLRHNIIINLRNPNGTPSPYYSIVDGLRELLRDLAAMQAKEHRS